MLLTSSEVGLGELYNHHVLVTINDGQSRSMVGNSGLEGLNIGV